MTRVPAPLYLVYKQCPLRVRLTLSTQSNELIYKTKTDHFHPTDEFYEQIYIEMKENMFKYYSKDLFTLVKDGFCGFVNYSKLF